MLYGPTDDIFTTEPMCFANLRKLRIIASAQTREFQTAANVTHLSVGGGIHLEMESFKHFIPWTRLQSLHLNDVHVLHSTLFPILRLAPNLSALDLHHCGTNPSKAEPFPMTDTTMP